VVPSGAPTPRRTLMTRTAASLAGVRGSRPAPASVGRLRAQRRRRDVLSVLAGSAVLTLVLAIAFGGRLWMAHLAVDALLGGYVYLLVQARKAIEERQVKVRYLPTPRIEPAPAFALRRAAR
jgi:hypothetical protein